MQRKYDKNINSRLWCNKIILNENKMYKNDNT